MLGKFAPGFARTLDGIAIYVKDAPVVSIPIAVCLFFMMYPIMVKIDFAEVLQAGKSIKPVGLTLFMNWAIKPFTMYLISLFFLGTLFYSLIGAEAIDLIKMPFGLDLLCVSFAVKNPINDSSYPIHKISAPYTTNHKHLFVYGENP